MAVWPLTGRSEELAFILTASEPAAGPRGVVLAGAAGVGKTRLARETLELAATRGATTRWIAATESARTIPLGAFASLLRPAVTDSVGVVGHVAEQLVAERGRFGVIVGVDDAHLLDALSALVVQRLVLQRVATVIVTVRSGEPAPDTITALWKDEHLDRLELQPLSEVETAELVAAVLGGPLESLSLRPIWDLTRGNVLFLRLLVDAELQAGRLHSENGVWRWSGDPVISPALTELIAARMGRLSDAASDVVDLLALGEPLGVTLLGQLTDPAAVETAEAHGLLSVEHDGQELQARLAHPLYGEVRRAHVGQLRARRLRGQLATALAEPLPHEAYLLRRATLTLDSDLDPDPQLLTVAARSASQLVDLDLTARLARAAIDAGGAFEPRLTLARTLSFQNRADEAEATLVTLNKLAASDVERTLVAFVRAANLLWTGRRPLEAAAVLDDAEAVVTDDGCRLFLAGLRAATHACEGRPGQAVSLATETLAADDLPALAVMGATYGLVAGLGVLGRADELASAAARGYAEADRSADVAFLRFGLAYMHVGGLRLAGYIPNAEAVVLDCRQQCASMPGAAQLYGVAIAGLAALARGHLQTALRWLREAQAGLEASDTQGFGFVTLLHLTEALALAGEPLTARLMCDRLEADRHPAFAYLEPELLLTCAWVAAAEGGIRRAVGVSHDAAAEAVRLGQPAHEVVALHTAARLGDRTVAARLATLAQMVDGPRVSTAAAHAAALASDDGAGLNTVSNQLEDMGDLLAAADAAAQAAAAFLDCGRSSSATAAAARARRLADDCQGARTPALVAAARPLPLTGREREVVTLAAQGLSSRQIADKLFLSVRTIEGHLYNASAKLGTTSRAEFAALLSGR